MLLRARQMAQQIAASPTMWNFDPVGMYFCTHSQNWSKEQGLQLEPTTMATRLHTNLAMEHSKDIWEMVSSSGQKQHFVSLCHFLFRRLSLVSMAFYEISHIKVLIFKGILALQSFLLGRSGSSTNR